MIVNRRTFVIKRGCWQEAVAMVKAEQERLDPGAAFRLYTPNIAPFDILAMEWEYGSLEEYEKAWGDYSVSPEAAEFMERWYELTETGGTSEVWDLET